MRNARLPLMLFAAGRGTRMGSLTQDRPKPLVEVAGVPLIDHALGMAEAAGAAPIVVNTHYLAPMIEAHLGERVRYSPEPTLLETGGGLRAALPLLGKGPLYTLNSDAVWTGPNPLATLAAAWEPERMDGLLLLVPRNRAVGHGPKGDFDLADGLVARGQEYIYTGAQIIRPDGLAGIAAEVFSLNLLWDEMIAANRLYGVVHPGRWCDVGRPEGIALGEAMLADG